MNQEERRREFDKFKDDAVIYREREAAMAGMNLSAFISAVGPLGVGLLALTASLPTTPLIAWIIMGSSPVGALVTLVNWLRVPKDYRGSKPVLRAVLLSLAAAVATWVLVGMFPLRAAPAPPPETPPVVQ